MKMGIQNRLKDCGTMRTLGLLALILASISKWFLHPTAHFGPGLVDAAMGFLYGTSIGFLLLSLKRTQPDCQE
jgi:hypothetical protein